MKEYEIVAILWEDHYHTSRSSIPKNPDRIVARPTLTIGVLISETKKTMLVAHDIERYEDRDDSSYTVILKKAVVSRKGYGKISLDKIRFS